VVFHLFDGWSLLSVIAEESKDQVLEVFRETGSVHFLEVSVVAALEEEIVEVLFLASFLEWEDALHDDEDNDAN
jgi:hypothetical protein